MNISAIIVNYNAGDFLLACVQSVIAQVAEVIVIDNASNDQSISTLQAALGGDSRVHIIFNSENLGFARACNLGARAAKQPYWLFLNPDCLCAIDAVPLLYQALVGNPTTGMVGGLLLNADGSEQAGGRRLTPTPSRTLIRALGLAGLASRWPKLGLDFNLHLQPLPTQPTPVDAISGACMLVKPEAVSAVGYWDEGYFLHCEDLDWCMRFWRADWKVLFVPASRITHTQGVCSKSRPLFVEWHKHKGMSRFYLKFFRADYGLPMLGLVIVAIWIRFGLFCGLQFPLRILNKLSFKLNIKKKWR